MNPTDKNFGMALSAAASVLHLPRRTKKVDIEKSVKELDETLKECEDLINSL